MDNIEKFFERINQCPWCESEDYEECYTSEYDAIVVKCNRCGMVYSKKILNELGRQLFWTNYENEVHNIDKTLYDKRQKMYRLESDFVKKFIECKNGYLLDVGCSGGEFMDCFAQDGMHCEGIEVGDDAYKISSEKYKVYKGDFSKINIDQRYDVIIFRGTIQYFINPKQYFIKAMNLLNKGGILYIYATNAESLCFGLFKEKFDLACGVTEYYAYNEKMITDFINELGGELICCKNFYLESPYAQVEKDIVQVAKALECKNKGETIDFRAPAFYDNLLSLVYKKK